MHGTKSVKIQNKFAILDPPPEDKKRVSLRKHMSVPYAEASQSLCRCTAVATNYALRGLVRQLLH